MKLFERVDLIAKEKCGSRKVLAEKLGIPQTTFNGYFNDKGQKNFRGEHLERIFVLFPDVNPVCLLNGTGEMFQQLPGRAGRIKQPDMIAHDKDGNILLIELKKHAPIAGQLTELEQAMTEADDLAKIEAMIASLKGQHQALYKKQGGYGKSSEAREPGMFHEDPANYPAGAEPGNPRRDPAASEEDARPND